MIRVVLDANVLIAALPATSGTLAEIIDHWRAGRFEIAASSFLLAEVARSWRKPYWAARMSAEQLGRLMTLLEFLVFSPMLLIGLASKVLTLRFPVWQKILLFIPAILLSPITFGFALLRFPQFAQSRRAILQSRDNDRFWLLKTIIQQKLD